MSDHKPECFSNKLSGDSRHCICPELRACEKRVLDAIDLPAANRQYQKVGYADGLDAAREAVKGVNWFNDEGKMLNAIVATADALAAIDALRGES